MKEDNNSFAKVKDREKIAKLMAEKNTIHIKYGSGNFFNVFGDDAIIINYLFQYKIVSNNKVGFPRSALNKVVNALEEKKISYLVFDNEQIIDYHNYKKLNNYEKILEVANKTVNINMKLDMLIDKIKKAPEKKLDEIIEAAERCLQ